SSTGALILFIHHHNKADRTQTTLRQRSSGSNAFLQVVRHQLTMSVADSGERALAVGKTNITDGDYTVRRYEVVKHPQLPSAFLVPGELVEGVRNIDGFNKRGHDDPIEIDVVDEVQAALRLVEDERLPGAKKLHGQLRKTDRS